MRWARNRVRTLLFSVALIASLVVSSGTASAASDYDSVVTLTDQAKLEQNSSHGSGQADISNNWYSIFSNCNNWTSSSGSYAVGCTAANAALSAARAQGHGWAVVQRTVKYDLGLGDDTLYVGDKFVTVVFNPESDTNAVFRDSYYGRELHVTGSSYTYGFNIVLNNNPTHAVPVVSNGQRTTSFSSDFTILDDSGAFNYWSSDVYFSNIPITYPSGYEGVQIPTVPPLARYVAMGDSFSSGEGNSPFEVGTDEDGVNECHRSVSAYPNWLSQTPSLNLGRIDFVACSGATTKDVLGVAEGGDPTGKWNEPTQVDALSEDTEVVTITIGGNDIGFSDFAKACVKPTSECDSSTTIYSTTMYKIHNILPGNLQGILTEVADRTSHAKVYVIGYPYATPSSGLDSLPIQCSYLSSSAGNGADSLAARDVVTELNSEIGNAVTGFTNTLSDTEFEYIDPNTSVDGSFDGHDLCQGLDSYFHNVAPNDVFGNGYSEKIFHPNVNGQYEYYKIVSGAIDQN